MGAQRGKGGQARRRTAQGSATTHARRQSQSQQGNQTARKPTLEATPTNGALRQTAPANIVNSSNGSNGSNGARKHATNGPVAEPIEPRAGRFPVARGGDDSAGSPARVATLEPEAETFPVAESALDEDAPIAPTLPAKDLAGRGSSRAQTTTPETAPADPDTDDDGKIARTPLTPARFAEPEQGVSSDLLAATLRDLLGDTLRGSWNRVRRLSYETWVWIAVLALATFLRFWNLGAKPLHHDESMHAFYSLMFARDPSSYIYDPLLHGPFQFHAEGIMFAIIRGLQALFHVGGPGNNPWINDATARIVPAAFGVGIVALPLGLRREIGRLGALVAAFLLAVSPAFVYFSRFLREDIYFNFFMFAMVVCAVRFAHRRSILWLALTMLATVLAYATFEGIYLSLAIFGAFLAALIVWEIAWSVAKRLPSTLSDRERLFFSRAGLLALLAAVGAVCAYVGLHIIDSLNVYILANQNKADAQVAQLEANTVAILLYVSIGVAVLVILALLWQITVDNSAYNAYSRDMALVAPGDAYGAEADPDNIALDDPLPASSPWVARTEHIVSAPGRAIRHLHDRLDPDEQPLLRLLLGGSWAQWFVAFVVGWMAFAALYWAFPTQGRTLSQGFEQGIGKGIWQGLYYWIQQQHVARGGQPIYYYFLLIPLYEQLAVVFGLAGVIYAVLRPTRLRLFLVWWFVGSLAIYSWAGEKMPWLSIHILLPLFLLAAIVVAKAIEGSARFARDLSWRPASGTFRESFNAAFTWRARASVLGVACAILLLIPMVHSMYLLSQPDAANGPLEMMVYVQTTPDVDTVMSKITYADQKLYGGRHQLQIVVGAGEEWPFYWYLRDYWLDPHPSTYVTFDPTNYTSSPDVLILLPGEEVQQFLAAHPTGYTMKQYRLRAWFDESYKPLQCVPTKTKTCPPPGDPLLYGQGLGPYLSYGSNPPPNATFNLGKAAPRLWNWLWYRQPLGATTGSYDFVFVVRNGLPIQP